MDLSNGMTMEWGLTNTDIHIRLQMIQPSDQDKWTWFGIAFNTRSAMLGGDAIAVEPALPPGQQINRYFLKGYESELCVASSEALTIHPIQTMFTGQVQMQAVFSRPLRTNGTGMDLTPSDDYNTYVTWAWGYEGYGSMSTHTSEMSGSKRISLTKGGSLQSGMWMMIAHGILSLVGVFLILPHLPHIDKRFQEASLQLGSVLFVIGFGMGFALPDLRILTTHSQLGIAVFLLGAASIAVQHRAYISVVGRLTSVFLGIVAAFYGIRDSSVYYSSHTSEITSSGTAVFSLSLFLVAGAYTFMYIRRPAKETTSKVPVIVNPIQSWAYRTAPNER